MRMSSEYSKGTSTTDTGYPGLPRQESFNRANEMMDQCREDLAKNWRKILKNPDNDFKEMDKFKGVCNSYLHAFRAKCDQKITDLPNQSTYEPTVEDKLRVLADLTTGEARLRTDAENAAMSWKPSLRRLGEIVSALARPNITTPQDPHLGVVNNENELLCRYIGLFDGCGGDEPSDDSLIETTVLFTEELLVVESATLFQEHERRHGTNTAA